MESAPVLSDELLRRLDRPGPRYTSYPTADRLDERFGAPEYRAALQQRAARLRSGPAPALSVYVHVPFCESVCYYCACNKVVTRHHERAADYLRLIEAEVALHAAELGRGAAVSQLHLGGGTPTFLSDAELDTLMATLGGTFALQPEAEVSIEVDPRTATPARLAHLRGLGFNRVSFGVQDFDPAVQQAVHREQSLASVQALIEAARGLGFASINTDLIYGLPRQTPASFERTVAQVAALRPDRIALYAYAHLPERFKPQRRIAAAELPGAGQRIRMLGGAIAGFIGHGYEYIGMDHFALPGDALAVARREGRLHRNFQGYTTQPECDLIGLGVSAIGRVGDTYSQNAKSLPEYGQALREGRFAVVRGVALTPDDRLRRELIMALMCQGRLSFEAVERAHGLRMHEAFADELQALQGLADEGLVALRPDAVEVTPLGWYFVRTVAMTFDRRLRMQPGRTAYSRVA